MYRRKKVFDGRLLQVYEGRKGLPNGKTGFFEEIEHPGASIVVPFYRKKIILIRQYRAVIGRYIWELPAGTLDPGESPYACAKREIIEETGYIAGKIRKIGYVFTTPGFCNEKIHVFRAECLERCSTRKDVDEIINVRLFRPEEIGKRFRKGLINDSKTIAALSFAGVL